MPTASKAQKRQARNTFVSLPYMLDFLLILQRMRFIDIKVTQGELYDWLGRRIKDINKDIQTGKAAKA